MRRATNLARARSSVAEEAPRVWLKPQDRDQDVKKALSALAAAGPASRRISQPLVVGALALFDSANIAATGLLSYLSLAHEAADWRLPLFSLVAVTAFSLFVLRARWAYTIRGLQKFPRQSVNLALALAGALALWLAFCVLAGAGATVLLRPWALRWFTSAWLIGVFGRAVFALATRIWTRQGRLARRTVIVGAGAHALETIEALERSGRGALQILGVFEDRDRARLPADLGPYEILGAFDDLEHFCRERQVDLLIVAIPPSAETRILHILQKLWVLPVDVRILALGSKLKLRERAYNLIGDVPFLPVFDKPLSDWDMALKSMFDRVAALGLIVLASPVLAFVALGVKLSSPGPILFVQKRYGFNNEQFGVFKFRSMYVETCDAAASRLVTRGDPRVTKFGALIRRTSLDELPQLFNVLRGDLSLVGPRPHATKASAAGKIYELAVDGYFARHRVKPGITGWAQINGWRGETDTLEKIEQRVAHDLHYIANWSLWLDIKILILTPVSVLFGKNAF